MLLLLVFVIVNQHLLNCAEVIFYLRARLDDTVPEVERNADSIVGGVEGRLFFGCLARLAHLHQLKIQLVTGKSNFFKLLKRAYFVHGFCFISVF